MRVFVYHSGPLTAPQSPDLLAQEVAHMQEGILERLDPDEFTLVRSFQTVPAFVGVITQEGLETLRNDPDVVMISLDEAVYPHLRESVPMTNSDVAHVLGFTGQGVTVAVLDTGIDADHPDLQKDLVFEACFCSVLGGCCPNGQFTQMGAGAAEDDNGHGTNVTGIITSDGIIAPTGMAPDAGIVAVKVLPGGAPGTFSDVVGALDWIYSQRPDVRIINMSLGGGLFGGDCDDVTAFTRALADVINRVRDRGVLTFASSGNSGSGVAMGAPACIANTLSVGAVYDANLGAVSFSNCTDSFTGQD